MPARSVFDTPKGGLSDVLINDQPLSFLSEHPVQGIFQVNITNLLRPGGENHLEIWPHSAISRGNKPTPGRETINLRNIKIGIAE